MFVIMMSNSMGGGGWSYLRPLYSFPLLSFLTHALSQQGLKIPDSAQHEHKTLNDKNVLNLYY